jgi:hypothetical protein
MRTAAEAGARAGVSVLRAILLASVAVASSPGRVHAEPPARDSSTEDLLHLELEGGYDTPLGAAGLSVELHVLPRLVVAGGLGVGFREQTQLGLSSRFRLWSRGDTSVSAGLGLSRNGDRADQVEMYQRPHYPMETVVRRWSGVIRLNPEISVEHRLGRRWSVRGFGGLGVILTGTTCTYSSPFLIVQGCLSPDVPAPYRYEYVPLLPYAGVAIAAGVQAEPPGGGSRWFGSPWYGWEILLGDVAATAGILGGSNSSTVGTDRQLMFYGGFGLYGLGGPIIHLTHKNEMKAVISFALRTLPALIVLKLARVNSNDGGTLPNYSLALGTMATAALIDWTVLGWGGGVRDGDR